MVPNCKRLQLRKKVYVMTLYVYKISHKFLFNHFCFYLILNHFYGFQRLNKEKERERVSVEEPDGYYEPLERLKRLESRLQSKDNQAVITDSKLSNIPSSVRIYIK